MSSIEYSFKLRCSLFRIVSQGCPLQMCVISRWNRLPPCVMSRCFVCRFPVARWFASRLYVVHFPVGFTSRADARSGSPGIVIEGRPNHGSRSLASPIRARELIASRGAASMLAGMSARLRKALSEICCGNHGVDVVVVHDRCRRQLQGRSRKINSRWLACRLAPFATSHRGRGRLRCTAIHL